jgi:EAL and modified HD-GYP domain-containing signal transduction protein
MNIYTARQAIFNRKQQVIAYELLFRDSEANYFPDVDPHHATSQLIMNTHLSKGLREITQGKPALINFAEESLLKELPLLLPQKQVMVEILENVSPSDDVYEACRDIYHKGYSLALDDFIYNPEWARFIKLAKLIKIDLQKTPLNQVLPLIAKLKKRKNLKLLAEKVETHQEFEQAKELGFNYFQGYFFCKPEITSDKGVESCQQILFQLCREISQPTLNINKIAQIFEQDVGLTYKMLRYINNFSSSLSQEISSIKQAIVYLGEESTRKLIALFTTIQMAESKPEEVIHLAFVRAKFCEILAEHSHPELKESAFLTGLFSLLDAILDQPFDKLLQSLPLAPEISSALLGKNETPLKQILTTVIFYESGKWYQTEREANKLHIQYKILADFYHSAIISLNDVYPEH